MTNPVAQIETLKIKDWPSFHALFAAAMGFPSFYGGNMDAWIDCMTSLDEPADGMTKIHAPPGSVLVLQLSDVDDFALRRPDLYAAIIEGVAFVNWRRIETGQEPVLSLSFHKTPPPGKFDWASSDSV